jgi:GrpB-like predicted nucleotidyltransferase (UPF0157 family)
VLFIHNLGITFIKNHLNMRNTLGLTSGAVRLLEYTAEWRSLFEEERFRLANQIGEAIIEIQHIGSTAIPGMIAKPILDMAIAVVNFEEAYGAIPKMEGLGYTYRGENGIPRRHYFVKGEPRTHHLHMVEIDSEDWLINLRFRDYLIAHPTAAEAYSRLKSTLAEKYPNDREAYQAGKARFIQEILRKTRHSQSSLATNFYKGI